MKTIKIASNGRAYFYDRKRGRVYWYRAVLENKIGRLLLSGEEGHHRNGDKTDDRPENVEVLASRSAHARLHGAEKVASRTPCSACGSDRTPEKRLRHRTLCQSCYVRSDEFKAIAKRTYEKNRERVKARRDVRRARQRALGQRVT